jgi:hypothetical protein
MPSKKTPAERFREFAAKVSPPPTSLLACAHVPTVSAEAQQTARLMLGDLGADADRVDRIAASLDRLVKLNEAAASGKQRRGSGR